jgi:hypothetical protein
MLGFAAFWALRKWLSSGKLRVLVSGTCGICAASLAILFHTKRKVVCRYCKGTQANKGACNMMSCWNVEKKSYLVVHIVTHPLLHGLIANFLAELHPEKGCCLYSNMQQASCSRRLLPQDITPVSSNSFVFCNPSFDGRAASSPNKRKLCLPCPSTNLGQTILQMAPSRERPHRYQAIGSACVAGGRFSGGGGTKVPVHDDELTTSQWFGEWRNANPPNACGSDVSSRLQK